MLTLVDRFLLAQNAFTERVRAVRPDQWALPTPNVAWTVADLVDHVASEQRWASALVRGLGLDAAARAVDEMERDAMCPDLAAAWDVASTAAALAVTDEDAMAGEVALVHGSSPAPDYVRELIFDMVVHAWDLCRAIGYDVMLPAEIVDPVWAESKDMGDLSHSGLFDLPVDVPDDAPTIYRLVAMTGRDPL